MKHMKTMSKPGVPASASILQWFWPIGNQKKGPGNAYLAAYIDQLFFSNGSIDPEDID
jgi:hypothetical protein